MLHPGRALVLPSRRTLPVHRRRVLHPQSALVLPSRRALRRSPPALFPTTASQCCDQPCQLSRLSVHR